MRKSRLVLSLSALALAIPAAFAPVAAQAQAQRDWSRLVATTPEGGYRMGNPDAPVKVVEFISLTCPHCAAFATDGMQQLIQRYVRTGRVSLELRNFVLNGVDLAAATLSRCTTPQNYFALNHAILAAQPQWSARIQALPPDQYRQMSELPRPQALAQIASVSGLDAIAARHGVSAQRAASCFADDARLSQLATIGQAAAQLGVTGTPSFLINGQLVAAGDWAELEPLLRSTGR